MTQRGLALTLLEHVVYVRLIRLLEKEEPVFRWRWRRGWGRRVGWWWRIRGLDVLDGHELFDFYFFDFSHERVVEVHENVAEFEKERAKV